MAISTCAKCGGHSFQIQQHTDITEAAYVLSLVQCASCGTVIGVTEEFNIGYRLFRQDNALKKIAAALNINVDDELS